MRIGMLFCLTIGMLLTAKPARAATLLVCKPSGDFSCTYSTIGAAVAAAHAGDTIHVGSGTYDEHDITIGKDLTIIGAGSGSVTVDAQNKGRVFNISFPSSVTISGMTLTNGYIYDDVVEGILNGGTLSLDDVIVSHNSVVESTSVISEPYGGGIYSGGVLTMTNSQVFDNVAYSGGAGICILEGTTTHLTKVLIECNDIIGVGGNGGGIYLKSSLAEPSSLTLDQDTLGYNDADTDGGGLYANLMPRSPSITVPSTTMLPTPTVQASIAIKTPL